MNEENKSKQEFAEESKRETGGDKPENNPVMDNLFLIPLFLIKLLKDGLWEIEEKPEQEVYYDDRPVCERRKERPPDNT